MPDRKYDYPALKGEFIADPKLSIRDLARRHNIPQDRVSSIHAQARKPDELGRTWYDLQKLAVAADGDAAVTAAAKAAERRHDKAQKVVDKLIDAVGHAADRFNQNEDPVTAKDLAVLARELPTLVRMIGSGQSEGSTLPPRRDDDQPSDLRIPIPTDGPLAILLGRVAQATGVGGDPGDREREGTRALPAPVGPREDANA